MMQQNTSLKDQPPSFYQNTTWRLVSYAIWIGLLVVLLGLFLASAIPIKPFWTSANARNIIQTWLVAALIVPPMVLVVASGGLDLSVGAVAGLTVVLMASLLSSGGSAVIALVVGLFVALVVGVINGLLVGVVRIHGAVVTLGMLTLLKGIAWAVSEGRPITVGKVDFFAALTIPAAILTILLAIAAILFVELTPFGRRRFLGLKDNPSWIQRSLISGVPYVLSALMAGIAGVLYLGRLRVGMATVGTGLEVEVLLAVFMGGTLLGGGLVNVIGAMLASLLVSLGRDIAVLGGLSSFGVEVIKGVLFVVFAALSQAHFLAANWLFKRRQETSGETASAPKEA